MIEISLQKRYYNMIQIAEALQDTNIDYEQVMKVYNKLTATESDDVVPVIRCCECKYNENDCWNHGHQQPRCDFDRGTLWDHGHIKDENHFCAWAERREDD